MTTFKELKLNPTNIKNITKLDTKPKYMWSMGRYDGVLSGVCEYNGVPHYFHCFKDYYIEARSRHSDRLFAIMELPLKSYLELKFRNEMFRDLVGWHTTYDENGILYPTYPEFSNFTSKSKEEKELMCKQYCDIESKKINYNQFLNDKETFKTVAYWSSYDIRPLNIENNKNREKTLLLAMLKDKIIGLSNEQKDNKEERKTNDSFNQICWLTARDIRAHLIAYTLLRGKSYNSMETHFKYEDEPWFSKYRYKLSKTYDLIKAYGTKEDIVKWSLKDLEAVLRPSNGSKVV